MGSAISMLFQRLTGGSKYKYIKKLSLYLNNKTLFRLDRNGFNLYEDYRLTANGNFPIGYGNAGGFGTGSLNEQAQFNYNYYFG